MVFHDTDDRIERCNEILAEGSVLSAGFALSVWVKCSLSCSELQCRGLDIQSCRSICLPLADRTARVSVIQSALSLLRLLNLVIKRTLRPLGPVVRTDSQDPPRPRCALCRAPSTVSHYSFASVT